MHYLSIYLKSQIILIVLKLTKMQLSKGKTSTFAYLSDKDIQLIKKNYSKLAQIYYENKENKDSIQDLLQLSKFIVQVISTKQESDALTLISTMQILKVKSKACPQLIRETDFTIEHLKNPKAATINYQQLIYCLKRSQLFVVGCTVGIRFFDKINNCPSQFDWKQIISQLSRNISINAVLCIQYIFLICRNNEIYSRLAVKSGLVKYVFLSYLSSTIKDRFNLYKAIKLLKTIANVEKKLINDKQKSLALIIYTYSNYIPVIQQICSKCYDQEYGQSIDNKRRFDPNTIDQPYLWSYNQSFCGKNLSVATVAEFFKMLEKELGEQLQNKVFAILNNFSRFRSIQFQELLSNCKNAKILEKFKHLDDSKNKDHKIGKLDQKFKKRFDVQKDAGYMMERVSKIPKNNEQLGDIIQVLKQKDRANQFQSDTLKNVKQRALNSLKSAIVQKHKLNLNLVLKEVQLNDVQLLSKLLQILELNITMNEDLIDSIHVDRVMEIIRWVQDNYKGQMIQWGSISQLITILNPQMQWKNHLANITEQAHWILGVQLSSQPQERQNEQKLLIKKVVEVSKNSLIKKQKLPLILGFLGRVLTNKYKINLYKNHKELFQIMFNNIKNNQDYKLNVLMMSYYIKNWSENEKDSAEGESAENKKYFQEIIGILTNLVLNNFRNTQQEYELLQKALPYSFFVDKIDQNIQYLINLYGKLASYIYKQKQTKTTKMSISYNKIKKIANFSPQHCQSIFQTLRFLQQNSEILQEDELSKLLDSLTNKKLIYWSVYPNFANIMFSLLEILKNTNNSIIKDNISNILLKIIQLLNINKDISSQQKEEILQAILECLGQLQTRQIFVQKQKLIKICQKIQSKEMKQQLVNCLENYKIVVKQIKKQQIIHQQQIENQEQNNVSHHINDYNTNTNNNPDNRVGKQIVQEIVHNFQEQGGENANNVTFQEQWQVISNKKNVEADELDIYQALRQLKKIIEKELPYDRYQILHQVFLTNELKQQLKDVLGHLIAKFYPNAPQNLKKKALILLGMKDKTSLSQATCYQLMKTFPEVFGLAKRWRLKGRQWLILAMTRFTEGYYGEASQVLQYNIVNQPDIQYFYENKFHEIVRNGFDKICVSQAFALYLVLIGTSVRLKQIKQYYIKQKLHLHILNAYSGVITSNMKIICNISYALSAIAFSQPEVSVEIAQQQKIMQELLFNYKLNAVNKVVVESGCSLIANLAFSNDQAKQLLRRMKISQILMIIFELNVQVTLDENTCKQLLRAIGNLSISAKFSIEIIEMKFCSLAVKLAANLDVFNGFDDKKARLMKVLIDLIANLVSHKYKLQIFHTQKLTELILKLLENSQAHPQILSSCIDTIDCLCQNQIIQNYIVAQKKIPYLLVDVLKIQTQEKIIVKSIRLLTNLTINQQSIPIILEANLLSVMANIVMPHFYGNNLAAELKSKMENYILKIITRISNSKQSKQLILKSGYLDCLIKTIQTAQVIQEIYIEILYMYSSNLPSFLTKRAFLCLIRIIMKKMNNRQVINKCFKTLNNFSNKFQSQQNNQNVQAMPLMYEKQFDRNLKQDFLYLLGYHLLRSQFFRKVLAKKADNVYEIVKKMSLDIKFMDICKEILFLIFNRVQNISELQYNQNFLQSFSMLKKGFKCNLYRIDGSSKTAIIDITDQFKIRAYKFPNGQIKDKYIINLRNLKEFNFNYQVTDDSWLQSVFTSEKGLFDFTPINSSLCVTLLGLQKWREINFINVSFESSEDKLNFIKCICSIYKNIE